MILVGYKKCSTCQGIEKILKDKNIAYTYREIDKDIPSSKELEEWLSVSGLNIQRFFNSSGLSYRRLQLKDWLKEMSQKDKLDLLASDGMLIKRPILLTGQEVLVGPDVKKYLESLS